MTTEAATEPMPTAPGPPATVTVRRSWAIGGAVAVAAVIVAMALALVAVAGDGGERPGFPPPIRGDAPASGQGMAPPAGVPGGGMPGGGPGESGMPGRGSLPAPPQAPGSDQQPQAPGRSTPNGGGSSN